MTTTLTPALALDYISALSADVRAAVILDSEGAVLAGPTALREPAAAFLAHARGQDGRIEAARGDGGRAEGARGDDGGAEAARGDGGRAEPARAQDGPGDGARALTGRSNAGAVFAARDDHHAIVVITGPHALARVTLHDLRTALSALGGETLPETPPERVPDTVASALLSAISAS